MISEDLAERAAEALYTEREKRFSISPPRPSRAYRNDRSWKGFLKVGELCEAHGWDPYAYVRFCLDLANGNAQFIVASDLSDARMRKAYERATKDELEKSSPEADWNFNEQELYKRAGKDETLQNRYLMSPLYEFPAWYRWVKGSGRTSKAWEKPAMEDIRSRTDLREFLASKFPKKMKGLCK